MSTPMHFRKRQLLEYQYETSLSRLNDKSNQIEYPSSPSSLDSGTSTPVGDVPADFSSTSFNSPPNKFESSKNPIEKDFRRRSVPSMDINRTSYDLDRSNIFSYHNYAKRARTEDVHFEPKPFMDYSQKMITNNSVFMGIDSLSPSMDGSANNPQVLMQDAAALVSIANQLKQTIEANLRQQTAKNLSAKPKPSTILLAKLKELKEKSLAQKKKIPVPDPQHADKIMDLSENRSITSPGSVFVKQNVKTISPKTIGHNSDSLFDIMSIYASMLEERRGHTSEKNQQMSDEFNQPKRIKQETSSPHESSPILVQPSQRESGQTEVDSSKQEIQQIARRIASVFASANETQQRIEYFQKQGINVFEKTEIIENQESYSCERQSTTQAHHYMDTPTTSKFHQPTTLKENTPSGRESTNFVHVTADTLPDDLICSPSISIRYNDTPLNEISKPEDCNLEKYPMTSADDEDQVIIGPNGTLMSKSAWSKIDWSLAAPAITRKILMIIFDRETLATHSLTGRPSPAFKDLNKPEKKPLNTAKVADLVYIVTSRINASQKEIRMAITTKCADECKMAKWRQQRLNNKENKRIRPF